MSFVDEYSRSVFRYRPRKDSVDQECDDLILIARTARTNNDTVTLDKVKQRGEEFFQRHPEYKACCWGAQFEAAVS